MDDELVVLTRTQDEFEAEMLIGRLRAGGLEALLRRDPYSFVTGLNLGGVARYDVLVRSEDLVEACRCLGADG